MGLTSRRQEIGTPPRGVCPGSGALARRVRARSRQHRSSRRPFHIPLDVCAKAVLRTSSYMLWMRESSGQLHCFGEETAIATLSDIGHQIVGRSYTDDHEIPDEMIPGEFRPRLVYEARERLVRVSQSLAASICDHFNRLVPARGDRKTQAWPALAGPPAVPALGAPSPAASPAGSRCRRTR